MKELNRKNILYWIGGVIGAALLIFFFLFLPKMIGKAISEKKEASVLRQVREELQGRPVAKETVIKVLKLIDDPEFQTNIYDLGVVKEVALFDKDVRVVLQTYPHCPYKIELYLVVKKALEEIDGIGKVHVKIVTAEDGLYHEALRVKKRRQEKDEK